MTPLEIPEEALSWMKATDIVELAYEKAGKGFAFSLGGAPAPSAVPVRLAGPRSEPIASPAVGFYHATVPGQASKIRVGLIVAEGAALGFLEAGPKRWDIKSPAAGTLSRILIEEGQAAQYGQPLFVIQAD